MPKKSTTYSTEDMVLWQRVTSQVTPLKSTTLPVAFADLGADDTKPQNKLLKQNAKNQKIMDLNKTLLQSAENVSKQETLKKI